VRRLIARIGASSTARNAPAPVARVHATEPPRPAAAAVPPPGAEAGPARAVGPPAARPEAVAALATAAVAGAQRLAPVAAHGVAAAIVAAPGAVACGLGTPGRAGGVVRRPAARRGPLGAGSRLHRQLRARVPWNLLPRERLLAAWTRLLREHGVAPGELRLLGVYGPLPLGAVEGVVLRPDGRAEVRLARRRARGPTGDVALARHVPTGRLVRSDVPEPGRSRVRGSLR
jgi:hypothetical protein